MKYLYKIKIKKLAFHALIAAFDIKEKLNSLLSFL